MVDVVAERTCELFCIYHIGCLEMWLFLAHVSQRLRLPLRWAFLIEICLLSYTFHIFVFSSRSMWPISTKLRIKHLPMKGIQVCLNKGPHPFQGEIIANIHWQHLKTFFSRTAGPISIKLSIKHSLVRAFNFFQVEGHTPFQGKVIVNFNQPACIVIDLLKLVFC